MYHAQSIRYYQWLHCLQTLHSLTLNTSNGSGGQSRSDAPTDKSITSLPFNRASVFHTVGMQGQLQAHATGEYYI